jgi:CubicO group peptidase (beta-lactamase class C family)
MLWAATLLAASPHATLAQRNVPAPPPPAGLDDYVARALKQFGTPGVAIAIVKDGHVVLTKGYGVRRLGDPAPVSANTLFQIASNTKAFTTAALAMLVDSAKLRWDDHVTDFIPDFQLSDPWVTREFTVRDMLTHRSGLGLGAGDLLWLHSDYPEHEIVRRIRAAKPASSFRSQYAYDNVMYLAAGELIPAITTQSWAEFVHRRIFEPLGMNTASPTLTAVPPGAEMATPHDLVNGRMQIIAPDSADVIASAGAIVACVADLSKWLMVQLDSGRLGDRRLWSAARTREMWGPQTIRPIDEERSPVAALAPNFSMYGLGWGLSDYRGRKKVAHSGGLAGMTSRTILIPSERLGVVVLTNADNPLSDALALWAVDAYLGGQRIDWVSVFAADARRADSGAAEVERRAKSARATDSKPSLQLDRYAGRYTDTLYGDATIAKEDGHLVLRFAHSPPFVGDLEHWQYDTFVAHWRMPTLPDAYVTFTLRADGAIDTMKMAAVSPLADFSFDFQDLLFRPVSAPAAASNSRN